MATPTSHPRPSPQKPSNHLTPASASSPPPPPSSHSSNPRTHPSPSLNTTTPSSKRPFHIQSGHVRGASSGSIAMARTGTNGSIHMARTATNGSTPMARTATSTSLDSPAVTAAAAMLMEGMPRGLGLTPQGIGTGLTPGSIQMGPGGGSANGMSVLGPLDPEEERNRRMGLIVGLLAGRWGYVSQEGVERCAKRLGLECLWEEGMGLGTRRKRVLSIAGSGMLVEVDFEGDEVADVVLSFPSRAAEEEYVKRGAQVLKRDLKVEEEGGEFARLDGFVDNLERLGRMDRLGGESINCFDAVDGIYKSLEKIYRREKENARREQAKDLMGVVMCQRSGRPSMHDRRRVGLILQYWLERRFLSEEDRSDDAMETDESPTKVSDDGESLIWSAVVECEACPADLYPPIRISDAWVNKNLEKVAAVETHGDKVSITTDIDWADVPQTRMQVRESNDSTSGDGKASGDGKLPDVRFVAKFEPPVVVPLPAAVHMHESVGSPILQESVLPTMYDTLLFGEEVGPHNPLGTSPRVLETSVTSYNPITNTSSSHQHKSTLYVQPQDFGRTITTLPFKHPMQLINLLPLLRQWALVGNILRRSFIAPKVSFSSNTSSIKEAILDSQMHEETPKFQNLEDELADFLSSRDPSASDQSNNNPRNVNVSFAASPSPTFIIQFHNPRHGGRVANITFSIGLNGVIEGVQIDDGSGSVESGSSERVRRVIEIGEEIGVLVEWLCESG